MQMISLAFFAFAASVFAAVYICNLLIKTEANKVKVTKWILLGSSYLFIAYADYRFAMVLAVLTVAVWLCAQKEHYIKYGVIAALAALGFFKYTNFFAESFARLFHKEEYVALNVILPLGISFYTFSAISYLIDVKRKKTDARSLLDVALYLSFFSKITSGPIQKSEDFFEQIDAPRCIGAESLTCGIQIFCFGLFKKLVLADRLSVFVGQVFDAPSAFGSLTVVLAVFAYSFQIYFDFSGYSDMAIGAARILDIHLPRNFNLPYLSQNVTEFWKRWHITLSSWLQEYLYISLGGNRKGVTRTYVNLILTMILGGIWHGPKWTYVIWGLLHGLALAAHKIWMKYTGSAEKCHSPLSTALSTVLTFLFTSFCWVFFRADSIEKAAEIIRQIFRFSDGICQPYVWLFFAAAVLTAGSMAAMIKTGKRKQEGKKKNHCCVNGFYPILDLTKFWQLVLFFVFCGLIVGLAYTGGSPFIYGEY